MSNSTVEAICRHALSNVSIRFGPETTASVSPETANALRLAAAQDTEVQAMVLEAYADFVYENVASEEVAKMMMDRLRYDAAHIRAGRVTLTIGGE